MFLFVRRLILVGLISFIILSLVPASPVHAATTTFSGGLSTYPQYQRIQTSAIDTTVTSCASLVTNPTALPNYYYDMYPFYVDASGSYTMEITAANLSDGSADTYLGLHQTIFDPANALTNCLGYNDDRGGGNRLSRITMNLTAGTQYVLVVTTFDPGTTGTYSGQITGLGNITIGTVPAPVVPPAPGEPAAPPAPVITWFSGHQDGRINWREAYSPVALYAQGYGNGGFGLHIYNVGAGGPEPWLIVTPDMIDTAGTPSPQYTDTAQTADGLHWVYSPASGWIQAETSPGLPVLIGQTPDGYIRVYRLASGWFQVMAGPNAEGKISIIAFDRLCLGFNCAVYTLDEIDPQ